MFETFIETGLMYMFGSDFGLYIVYISIKCQKYKLKLHGLRLVGLHFYLMNGNIFKYIIFNRIIQVHSKT